MNRLALVLLTSLAIGGVALAAEEKGAASGATTTHDMQKTDKMKGPPNADGAAMKGSGGTDTTGSTGSGAAAAKATGESGDPADKKK